MSVAQVKFIDDVLPEGWMNPSLSILEKDAELAHILILQPRGVLRIKSDFTFIGNELDPETYAKYREFFRRAKSNESHLAATPEYSCPIEVIRDLLSDDGFPSEGKLWVIGSESISKEQLRSLRTEITGAGVTCIFEESVLSKANYFVDPIFYLFQTRDENNSRQKVVVIQFKTAPMGVWTDQRELNGIITGTTLYIIRNSDSSIYLLSFICSEVLDHHRIMNAIVKCHPNWIDHPYLILHPQLNPKPTNNDFRQYRQDLLGRASNKELLCLNWARGTGEKRENNLFQSMIEFSGSCYSLDSSEVPDSLKFHLENHSKGLFLVHSRGNRFHFYFDSDEWVFFIKTQKVSQAGAAPAQRRKTGPKAEQAMNWENGSWCIVEEVVQDDAFFDDYDEILTLLRENIDAIETERLLEFSLGKLRVKDSSVGWWNLRALNLLSQTDDEVVQRTTFSQDNSERAIDHRIRIAQNFYELQNTLIKGAQFFPGGLEKFAANSGRIGFDGSRGEHEKYHANLCTIDGSEWLAVVYLGDKTKAVAEKEIKEIEKAFPGQSRKRLLVWYRINSGFIHYHDKISAKITDNLPRRPSVDVEAINRDN